MNRDHDYHGIVDNQLRAFDHVGIFTEPLSKRPDEYDALPNPYDKTADLDARARTYLDVNCSLCHIPDGGGNAKMALRYAPQAKGSNPDEKPPEENDHRLQTLA